MTQLDEIEFWIDLNLPPQMAIWLKEEFGVKAKSFKELKFEITPDVEVYKMAAQKDNKIIITTEKDFVRLNDKLQSDNLYYLPIKSKFVNNSKNFDQTILNYVGTSTGIG